MSLSARRAADHRLALLALAVSAFAIGTTEFVITGVLPQVAATLQVTIPTAGLLVSGYALGVVIGAPTVTAAVLRLPRKQVLLGLLLLFVAGNVTTAIAPDYAVMVAGRVLAALCHGAFLGLGSVVAADLARPDRRARAIATMFAGLTIANVAGVPAGTFLGQQFGWRSTFWAIASLGVVSMISITLLVPPVKTPPGAGVRSQLAAFRQSRLWMALGITALGFGAVYAPFTYLAPMMRSVAHFAPSAIVWLLIVFGLGLVVGNPLGARAADRHLMTSITVLLAMLVGVLLLFDQTAADRLPAALTIFALGAIGFATVPAFTSLVLTAAGGSTSNVLASSAAVAAFNLGNATGAFLGGRVIAAGYGYAATNLVGATMAGAALLLAAATAWSAWSARSGPVPQS